MEKRKRFFLFMTSISILKESPSCRCCYYNSELHEVHEWNEVPLEKNDVARLHVNISLEGVGTVRPVQTTRWTAQLL
jgi:hypothetical protein